MSGRFRRNTLQVRVGELHALRDCATELGRDDPACTEKLLGQLAALEAQAAGRDPGEMLGFVPFRDCEALAREALAAARRAPLTGR